MYFLQTLSYLNHNHSLGKQGKEYYYCVKLTSNFKYENFIKYIVGVYCRLKKHAQLESFELSFIWGKTSTIAWETASLMALRNCSEQMRGEASVDVISVDGGYVPSNTVWRKAAASHEEQTSPLMILGLI